VALAWAWAWALALTLALAFGIGVGIRTDIGTGIDMGTGVGMLLTKNESRGFCSTKGDMHRAFFREQQHAQANNIGNAHPRKS
jgi:hypothetical protein